MIVMPDADLDTAANAAAAAAYGSTGQRCMAVSVLAVPHAVADACVEQVLARVSALRTGPASEESSDIGPLVSAAAQERVVDHIAEADAAGATLCADGREQGGDGYFVGPTLIDDVDRSMAIYREEVFGPVLSVVRVEGLDEAIELTNSNPFGNGAALFTNSGGAAREFCRRVTAGMIGINVAIPVPAAEHSFGGWKDSRFADVHMAGPEAFRFFTQGKIVTSRWPAPDRSSRVDYSFPGQ
jgi:malonate-semialdehyde dehydrogenase (acetylating)/methylmalonate-semialdehyde dehydrogenase